MIPIQLNGEDRTVAVGATLVDLIKLLELNPKYVAIEVNLQLVPSANTRVTCATTRSGRSRDARGRGLKRVRFIGKN